MWKVQGQLGKAIDDATMAIKLSPRLARAYQRRAEIWELCDNFAKAVEDHSMVVELSGTDRVRKWMALESRAAAYLRLGSFDKALNDYSALIEDAPDISNYLGRANAYRGLGDHQKAEADCNRALARWPDADVYYLRGIIREEEGRFDRALEDYEQVDELDPESYRGYQRRAWIWAACPDASLRNAERAIEAATEICQVTDWEEPGALVMLAAAYAEAGDFPSAVRWQTKALDMNLGDGAFQHTARPMLEQFRAGKPYRLRVKKSASESKPLS